MFKVGDSVIIIFGDYPDNRLHEIFQYRSRGIYSVYASGEHFTELMNDGIKTLCPNEYVYPINLELAYFLGVGE